MASGKELSRNHAAPHKGFIEEQTWTAVVFIVVLVLAIVALFLMVWFKTFSGSPLGYSIRFVDLINRPYMPAAVLEHMRLDDRHVLEHALEASVTGLSVAEAQQLEAMLRSYLDQYKLSYYAVTLKRGNDVVMQFDNLPNRCGDAKEGICQPHYISTAGQCGMSRVPIDGGRNPCTGKVCCKETGESEYLQHLKDEKSMGNVYKEYNVVKCGAYERGVCAPPSYLISPRGEVISVGCGQGRREESDDVCKIVNNKETLLCCVPISPETERALGSAQDAVIPLLYKNSHKGELIITSG